MKAENLLIRPYREDDRKRLKQLTVDSFANVSIDKNIEERYGLLNDTDWKHRKAGHIDDDIASNPEGVLVAVIDGEIVGYITVVLNHETGLGRIPNMAVDESLRGRGIGTTLIDAADDYMKASGMTHGKIETLDQNPIGQHLYPKKGYEEIARQVHFVKKL
jgi:GNAT superfamily N-acetyltransferase